MQQFAFYAIRASRNLNRWVERFCVALLVVLTLDVWLGRAGALRHPAAADIHRGTGAVPDDLDGAAGGVLGIIYREHIGVEYCSPGSRRPMRRIVSWPSTSASFAFFFALFYYGIAFAERGFSPADHDLRHAQGLSLPGACRSPAACLRAAPSW
jgi:hypothetical protein